MARERTRSLSDLPPLMNRTEPPGRSDMAPRSPTIPPGALPDLSKAAADPSKTPAPPEIEAADGQFEAGSFSPEDVIDEQIAELERWAAANERRDRNESVRFWILRGAAFLSAALAAAAAPLGYAKAGIILAACAALFIAIDAAWPGSSQRNPYRRAVYDLRALQQTVKLRWDKVRLAYPGPTSAKGIAHALALLDMIQAKRDEIGKYLGSAEPSSGVKRRATDSG